MNIFDPDLFGNMFISTGEAGSHDEIRNGPLTHIVLANCRPLLVDECASVSARLPEWSEAFCWIRGDVVGWYPESGFYPWNGVAFRAEHIGIEASLSTSGDGVWYLMLKPAWAIRSSSRIRAKATLEGLRVALLEAERRMFRRALAKNPAVVVPYLRPAP